jgi:D-glycero-D-manno-heptose 1,7-bisphosphate phosphatase
VKGRRAVFLDRDGVLAEPVVTGAKERPPWTLDELRIINDAPTALEQLRAAGYALVVVTNQPDVGRGDLEPDMAERINARLEDILGVDAVYACFHSGAAPCPCRKPAPGMVLSAADEFGLDLGHSWLVGDRWVDIAAGRAAGVRTVLLQRPGSWRPSSGVLPSPDLHPDHITGSISEAAALILGED